MPVYDSANLAERIDRWVERAPDQVVLTFQGDGGASDTGTLTFGELQIRAWAIAAEIGAIVAPGERVLLLFEPGLDFVCAFVACLYSGAVAVPTYPPAGSRLDREVSRLLAIAKDAGIRAVLTHSSFATALETAPLPLAARLLLKSVRWIATDALKLSNRPVRMVPRGNRQGLACLQYTSGSTGTPKGVMLTHACLLENLELISSRFDFGPDSLGVIWLPPYHDMGLIGGILQPLYLGAQAHLMSPMTFLRSPVAWLEAITRTRATTSGGPNFAYELCARMVPDDRLQGLDLRSWTVAFCGAEPVRAETLRRFAARFEPCGFRFEAFYPCYGLAEATLFVTGKPSIHEPPVIAEAPSAEGGSSTARPLRVSSGTAVGLTVAIVDPNTGLPLAEGREGEIWVSGTSVAAGYWNNPKATRQTFEARLPGHPGRFLRTGDLGYLDAGELFVTGRIKDLLILGGRNYYPQDLEATASDAHPAVRRGNVAAVAVSVGGFERLVVVAEVRPTGFAGTARDFEALISARIMLEHGLTPSDVLLVSPGTIPKTTSGKIRRYKCSSLVSARAISRLGDEAFIPPTRS